MGNLPIPILQEQMFYVKGDRGGIFWVNPCVVQVQRTWQVRCTFLGIIKFLDECYPF